VRALLYGHAVPATHLSQGKLKELFGRKASIEKRKADFAEKDHNRTEPGTAAQAITNFTIVFRPSFSEADHLKRKEMIQRWLRGIVVDRTAKVARCYFRPMSLVGRASDELIERVENAKGIPDSPITLRKMAVPGTGPRPKTGRGFRAGWNRPSH
jgi:hypothetical protein